MSEINRYFLPEAETVEELSSEQIIAFKEKLSEHGNFWPAAVCSVMEMQKRLEGNRAPVADLKSLEAVSFSAALTAMVLSEVISLPGDEWPSRITGPEDFYEALKVVEAMAARGDRWSLDGGTH